ncbi:MAG: hypothetical protein ABGW82_07270, partial [Paracoccus sp. (in: a-proteobacteria)]
DDGFRAAYLARLGTASQPGYEIGIEQTLDQLADHLETHLDMPALLALGGVSASSLSKYP